MKILFNLIQFAIFGSFVMVAAEANIKKNQHGYTAADIAINDGIIARSADPFEGSPPKDDYDLIAAHAYRVATLHNANR